MIQRIQTIGLLISAISSGFLMKGGIINFITREGQRYSTGFSGNYKINETGQEFISGSVPVATLIVLILILSVISIFLFKARRIQKAGSLIVIAFSICLMIMLTYSSFMLMKDFNADLVPGIKMFLPLLILAAAIIANKGISRDENLIKSYDRLR